MKVTMLGHVDVFPTVHVLEFSRMSRWLRSLYKGVVSERSNAGGHRHAWAIAQNGPSPEIHDWVARGDLESLPA
jgi:hypothetical protein